MANYERLNGKNSYFAFCYKKSYDFFVNLVFANKNGNNQLNIIAI